MFNYLFPIFCFGLVMTGIVFLGIMEASKHVKAESEPEPEVERRKIRLTPPSRSNSRSPVVTARSVHD